MLLRDVAKDRSSGSTTSSAGNATERRLWQSSCSDGRAVTADRRGQAGAPRDRSGQRPRTALGNHKGHREASSGRHRRTRTGMAGFGATPPTARRRGSGRSYTKRAPISAVTRPRSAMPRGSCSISVRTSRSRRIRASRSCFAKSRPEVRSPSRSTSTTTGSGMRVTHPVQLHLSGAAQGSDRRDHCRLRGGHEPIERTIAELRRLAGCELRSQVRRTVPDAVHAQVPLDIAREHEHRLARAENVSAEPGGDAARRARTMEAGDPLHHQLPLSERGTASSRTWLRSRQMADLGSTTRWCAIDPRNGRCGLPTAKRRATRARVVGRRCPTWFR